MNAKMSKEALVALLKTRQQEIQSFGVKRIGLFGSFIRGEQNKDSDVDLLIEFNDGQKSYDHFIRLSFLLEELLKRRVELVTFESLSPYLAPHILKEIEYADFSH